MGGTLEPENICKSVQPLFMLYVRVRVCVYVVPLGRTSCLQSCLLSLLLSFLYQLRWTDLTLGYAYARASWDRLDDKQPNQQLEVRVRSFHQFVHLCLPSF